MSSTAVGPRIGSLCSGFGGLDDAIVEVFGGSVAWHAQYDPADRHQYAARILHHWQPDTPNHGDITTIDYATVEPVDILAAGFPCQDVSLAGQRAGLTEGTRSGLWRHVARAIHALQPRLVVIENVPGLLSAKADGDVESCPWCLGDPAGGGQAQACSAGTWRRSWRPGLARVRCGVAQSPRLRHRGLPPARAGLPPRLACRRRGQGTRVAGASRTRC